MAGDGEEEPPATGGGGDKLVLRGLQFHGFHGVKQEEKKLGQKFVVDIDAWTDLAAAGDSDDISHTVSYTDIYSQGRGGRPVAEPAGVGGSVDRRLHAARVPPDLRRPGQGRQAPRRRAGRRRLPRGGDTQAQTSVSTRASYDKPQQN
uniref:Dihydroneopterin aldolase/epimerase domain-containing protein n=1 Tax=Hordeum vulgare subsp. vulgare TaxID=112509 RepID=A0A8I6W402_HORVV